jgi:hypothetical protein
VGSDDGKIVAKQGGKRSRPRRGAGVGTSSEDTAALRFRPARRLAGKGEGLVLLSVEVHAASAGDLTPNPSIDPLRLVVLTVMHDGEDWPQPAGAHYTSYVLYTCPENERTPHDRTVTSTTTTTTRPDDGVLLPTSPIPGPAPRPPGPPIRPLGPQLGPGVAQCTCYITELELLDACRDVVARVDPDLVVSFEAQGRGLGYLVDRAATLGRSLVRSWSRTTSQWAAGHLERRGPDDEYGRLKQSGIHLTGRVVLNLWRILRHEVRLGIYTFEKCVEAVLRCRVPRFRDCDLHAWYENTHARHRTVSHVLRRARYNVAMLDQLDLLGRTAEMARAYGIDFESVLTRGSQYRVESMLMRLARSQNFLLSTPTREQVANQPAMEAQPLILEPESRMYTSPVVVLDFQSLYPSIVIAYNMCYSTMLGRPGHAREEVVTRSTTPIVSVGPDTTGIGPNPTATASTTTIPGAKLGVLDNHVLPRGTLKGTLDPEKLLITPNGTAFAPAEARRGVFARMLSEILETRIMVKKALSRAGRYVNDHSISSPVIITCISVSLSLSRPACFHSYASIIAATRSFVAPSRPVSLVSK